MKLTDLPRLIHTLRHVRPVQIANRLQRKLIRPRVDLRAAPARRSPTGNWISPSRRPASLVAPDRMRVFQHEIELQSPQIWSDPSNSHLVRYNLHYFDDLNAQHADDRHRWHRDLIRRWVRENPPGVGTGWEPYPTSLRIVNWIKWALAGNELEADMLHSLAVQTRHLQSQLEFHLLANHLFANAKALVFCGSFFCGPEADAWLNQGVQLLTEEIDEQILNDGGHFELSPMYHGVILEDVLDLLNLAGVFGSEAKLTDVRGLGSTVDRMRHWLKVMSHPDGQIAFFNDAACEIACAPRELERYALALGRPAVELSPSRLIHLAESGYVRTQFEDHVSLLDVARVGPSYQPGHAHADTLSFEWSHRTHRVAVNSGTSCYGTSSERERQRSTAAHNTVEVDQLNSSEVWSGFRVARRAVPEQLEIDDAGEVLTVACAHSGYRRLPGRVTHRRTWEVRRNKLTIRDALSGAFQSAVARVHVHPAWQVVLPNSRLAEVIQEPARLQIRSDADLEIRSATYHPAFEIDLPSSVVACPFVGPELAMEITWSD